MYITEFDMLTLGEDGEPVVHRKNLQDFISFFSSTGTATLSAGSAQCLLVCAVVAVGILAICWEPHIHEWKSIQSHERASERAQMCVERGSVCVRTQGREVVLWVHVKVVAVCCAPHKVHDFP